MVVQNLVIGVNLLCWKAAEGAKKGEVVVAAVVEGCPQAAAGLADTAIGSR